MININLKPGAKRQAPKGDAMAAWRGRLSSIGERVKQPGLLIAGFAWVAVIAVMGGLYLHTQSQLSGLQPQLQRDRDEYQRYQVFVQQKHHEEKVRDSILTQIGTISSVDQDRYTWSHILDEVAGAVPDYTWLTTISAAVPANQSTGSTVSSSDSTTPLPVSVLITGETNDLENFTAFLRRLGDSPWLVNVLPVKTETIIDKGNRPVTSFTVQATFARADSSRIQTVPVLESTVR
jgi:Tfp pilus assembly protein PilN